MGVLVHPRPVLVQSGPLIDLGTLPYASLSAYNTKKLGVYDDSIVATGYVVLKSSVFTQAVQCSHDVLPGQARYFAGSHGPKSPQKV